MHASWQTLATRLPPPLLPRSGAAAPPLPTRDGFLLVGGYTEDIASGAPPVRAPTGETLAVRLPGLSGGQAAAVVTRLETSGGNGPPARLAAAGATTAGGTAWLIGGWDPGSKGDGGVILDDLWSVQVDGDGPLRWTPHPNAPLPGGPVSRHAAAALPDGRVVVHSHRCGETVLILHTATPRWESLPCDPDPSAGFPSSRGLASLVALPASSPPSPSSSSDFTLLLFGGAPKRDGMDNDMWRLLVPASFAGDGGGRARWERVGPDATATASSWPPPRCSHVAAALGSPADAGMVVWGGSFYDTAGTDGLVARGDAWRWDEREARWTELSPGGDAPPRPRNAAAAAAVMGPDGREGVLISGGWDPFRVTYGDSAVLWVWGREVAGGREK